MTEQIPINIEPTEVKALLSEDAIVLVDCREQAEWETAKISGAILMPMSNWANEVEQLKQLDGKRVVVHCHHGGRSLRVVRWMRENGFPDAQNMVGGIDAWSHQIDPSVPTY